MKKERTLKALGYTAGVLWLLSTLVLMIAMACHYHYKIDSEHLTIPEAIELLTFRCGWIVCFWFLFEASEVKPCL
jgi:hypothetical protein